MTPFSKLCGKLLEIGRFSTQSPTKAQNRGLGVAIVLCAFLPFLGWTKPLALHPENPHYFIYKGKPTVLIGSGEHYGAVLNLDFNYVKYLDELKAKRLNVTRTFTGAYVEPVGAFNITSNTLAPAPDRFICPWPRSNEPGYANGGNRFDLTKWDPAYFKRLKDFVRQAEKRDVIVEITLFCPFYEESQWRLSPQNASNNINGIGSVARTNVYTLDKNGGLLAIHEAMTRKIVSELKQFDNVYYEICNEPYFGGVTMEWQHHIADVIAETDKRAHLVSMNIANGSAKIQNPHPAVSIFNFHYAAPPNAVLVNYSLNMVIGDNETGFRGTNDLPYRLEAWNFLIAGGALFNHLDYSFAIGYENGTFVYPAKQPGGGNPSFRNQMKILREFIESLDFIHMRPDSSPIKKGAPPGMAARALADPGKAYAIYIAPTPVPKDEFSIRWTGKIEPKFSENYTFYLVSNDGVRLWIDNKLVIDNWTEHSEREDSGQIELTFGRKHDLRLEYFQAAGDATARLLWSSPSQPKEVVPETHLFAPDGRSRGLQARYYTGRAFNALRLSRADPKVDFTWSEVSPFAPQPKAETLGQSTELNLDLPANAYLAEWLNPRTGEIEKREKFKHPGGARVLVSPSFTEDIALRIKKQ